MPIERCSLPSGKSGYKVHNGNKCFPTREAAVKQMQAIEISKHKRGKSLLNQVWDNLSAKWSYDKKKEEEEKKKKSAKAQFVVEYTGQTGHGAGHIHSVE